MFRKSFYLAFGFVIASLYSTAQNGYCLKYALITKGSTTDTLQVFNLNGNSFNQVNKVADGSLGYRSLKLKDKPLDNYAIYPDNSYRMIPDVQLKEYGVTVMGKEQVNGFNCTKISVVTFKDGNICYLWISDEVPDYKNYLNCSVLDFKLDLVNNALKKSNIAGFPVKIAYKVPDFISYEFVKAGACDINLEMFDLGRYTNSKDKGATK